MLRTERVRAAGMAGTKTVPGALRVVTTFAAR